MVRLICLVKRKPGMGVEEFHRHWRDVHGPLVAGSRHGSWAVRYEQHHRAPADYERTGGEGYDGCTIQWFRSLDDFHASLLEPDYQLVQDDVASFLDPDGLAWVMTEEPVVVIDGPTD